MLLLLALAKYTPIGDYFSLEKLQQLIQDAGWLGLLVYFGVFMLGTLMNVPGAVFIVFAVLTWGYFKGIILSYFTAAICAILNFLFARMVGGQALSAMEHPRIKKVLARVESNPITTICWLRIFMLLSPVVNYALALTNIKTRQFIIGNAIAMILPFGLIIGSTVFVRSPFFQEVVLEWFNTFF